MIPKIIHYCWFGYNPKPKLAEKCIKSWKKKCPDYQIIEWNEDNFDIFSCPAYVRQAYEAKKWAFVTDYVRLKVVYDYGGIYLDTDVELRKNLDFLLDNKAYFGFEDGVHISTGLGFGAEKGTKILAEMMDDYRGIAFLLPWGQFDETTCPVRNTKVFLQHGLVPNGEKQVLEDEILILPPSSLNPIDYETMKKSITKDTVSIHWFAASWRAKEDNEKKEQALKKEHVHQIVHTPNRVLKTLLGDEKYSTLKRIIKR